MAHRTNYAWIFLVFVVAATASCRPQVTLRADRNKIEQGEAATLKWASKNAKTVTLNGETVPPAGTKQVTPRQTATYEIVAKRGKKEARDFARIEVTIPTPAPTLTFTAERDRLVKGEKTRLQWSSTHAERVTIDDIGQFPAAGSIEVSPKQTTTYTATAIGPSGTDTKSTRIIVIEPEAPSRFGTRTRNIASEMAMHVKTIYFAFDSAELTQESKEKLTQAALWLNQPENKTIRFKIEGHCDERGSQEYNFALGDRRANAVREFLISHNVSPDRIETQSYGEEKPVAEGHDEESWRLNRRAEFVYLEGGEKEVPLEQEP
ncbi:MAG: OmpA family protein [Acidobacteriota bacterium]|nr:OmpA family protein [Blastocatellia bacterium]MDW8240393.1 OmpA family protein [Acidobacteriota bacterium]